MKIQFVELAKSYLIYTQIDVKMARIFIVGNNDSSEREMKVFSESNDQVLKIRRNVDMAEKFLVAPVASHPVANKFSSQDSKPDIIVKKINWRSENFRFSRCQTEPTLRILNADTSSIDIERKDFEKLEIAGKNRYIKTDYV